MTLPIAERSTRPHEVLLHRQAVHLLGFDGRPQVVDRLRDEWRRAGLLEARSASVALASAGHCAQIHDFVDRMTVIRAAVDE